MHIRDSGRMASRLLFQHVPNFFFSLLIGLKQSFRAFSCLRIEHRVLQSWLVLVGDVNKTLMSRSLLNIAKRSLLRLMLSCVGLASKHAAG